MLWQLIIAVPGPSITITGLPTSPIYAGTSLLLTCTFQLHRMIDTPVNFNSIWRRGGQSLQSGGRVNISAISMINPSTYQTILNISPLSNTVDSGLYSCRSALSSDTFVLYTDSSQQVALTVGGLLRLSNFRHSERAPKQQRV